MKVGIAKEEHIRDLVRMGTAELLGIHVDEFSRIEKPALEELARRFMASEDREIFVVLNDINKAVGMAIVALVPMLFSPKSTMCQEIAWWVDKKHRGNGIGMSILEAIEKWATEKGATAITMVSHVDNPDTAVEIYKKHGFKEAEVNWIKKLDKKDTVPK